MLVLLRQKCREFSNKNAYSSIAIYGPALGGFKINDLPDIGGIVVNTSGIVENNTKKFATNCVACADRLLGGLSNAGNACRISWRRLQAAEPQRILACEFCPEEKN